MIPPTQIPGLHIKHGDSLLMAKQGPLVFLSTRSSLELSLSFPDLVRTQSQELFPDKTELWSKHKDVHRVRKTGSHVENVPHERPFEAQLLGGTAVSDCQISTCLSFKYSYF